MKEGLTKVKDPLYSYTYFGHHESTLTIVKEDVMEFSDDWFDSPSTKVDNPFRVTFFLLGQLYMSDTWFDVAPTMVTKNTCIREELGCMCSKCDNHYRPIFNIMGRDLYDHTVSTRIFTLIINIIFIWAQLLRGSGYGFKLGLQPFCINSMYS
jgi:hypothetical protein